MTTQDRDRLIRRIVQNPNVSKQDINAEVEIPFRSSREKILLEPWIQENTECVFGENIVWKNVEFWSLRNTKITPDLVGTDSEGLTVLVEIKFRFDFPSDKNHIRTNHEHISIGQILQYTCAYQREYSGRKKPRLFIVSIDHSPDVDAVCVFLQENDINIKHIAIENILAIK